MHPFTFEELQKILELKDTELEIDELLFKSTISYVEKLLDLAKENNIPIAVVASPKYGMISSEGLCLIKDICVQKGVKFIDYYAEEVFMQHREWFREQMHLNRMGAHIFSERLVADIRELTDSNLSIFSNERN